MHAIPWPLRPLLFTVTGCLTALAVYFLVENIQPEDDNFMHRASAAVAIATFSLVFYMVSRRDRLPGAAWFALLTAGVVAGICYWRLHIDWPHPFNFLALAVALFIAAPFYQSSLHSTWRNYQALHFHAWSNAVIIPLGLLFVALSFAMAYLLAELFALVGIDQLKQLLRQNITPWIIFGTALGASLGTLREHDNIIASTQRLVQSVFALLTAPLALGLGGFLLTLPFTGLDTLWNNTRNTSATLFSCALAALIFVNAVVREDTENQSHNRVMQLAARVLAVCLAPLALICALAIKLRVEQYGWTPDRLWASVIGALLLGYGSLYVFSALRRLRFNEAIRQTNLALAVLVCALAVLLATPLLDFGRVSLNDQMSRLHDGRITEDKLDVIAMAYDFGPAGRIALLDLRESASPSLGKRIDKAIDAKSRRAAQYLDTPTRPDITITVMNGPDTLPDQLTRVIKLNEGCSGGYCYLFWSESKQHAILLDQHCSSHQSTSCRPQVQRYAINGSQWYRSRGNESLHRLYNSLPSADRPPSVNAFIEALDDAAKRRAVELRPVQRQQLFIDGIPVGPTLP